MSRNDYELIQHVGCLTDPNQKTTKEVNIIRWGDMEEPQLDIRKWSDGEPGRGIALNGEEQEILLELLQSLR